MEENSSSVALVNCNIQEARNKTGGDYEIVAKVENVEAPVSVQSKTKPQQLVK